MIFGNYSPSLSPDYPSNTLALYYSIYPISLSALQGAYGHRSFLTIADYTTV